MKCRQAEQWMDAALDAAMARKTGEPGTAELLPDGWRAQLEAHLEGCARCRQLWTQLGAAHAALRVPRPVPAPAGMLAEFHRRAADAGQPAVLHPRPQPWLWVWPLASAAAGAAAAWMIAAHVAPLTAQGPAARMAESSPPPPMAAPSPLARSRNDRPAALAAAPRAGSRDVAKAAEADRARAADTNRLSFGRDEKQLGFTANPSTDRLYASPAPQVATNGLAERPQPSDKIARESLFARAEPATMAKRAAEAENRPVTLGVQTSPDLYYRGDVNAVHGSEQDPPELRVSPAVLTALQRTVEPASTTTSVQQAAQVLAQAADIALEVDPRVAHRTVTLSENGVPLWKALEVVAEQSQAQVLPVRDHLVLKPLPAAVRVPQVAGNVGLEKAPAGPAAPAPAPAGAAKPLSSPNTPDIQVPLRDVQVKAATAPNALGADKGAPAAAAVRPGVAGNLGQRAASARGVGGSVKQDSGAAARYSVLAAGAVPDRKVWGEAWGTLPERGFAVPSREEIPPQTLGLDAPKNTEPVLRQVAPGQQLNNANVLRRGRQQNSR